MSWNYRIMEWEDRGQKYRTIHEVYYDEEGKPNGYGEQPAWPMATQNDEDGTFEDLGEVLDMMQTALTKDILKASDFM